MKKALMVAVLIGVGLVSTSQAVVMSWSALVDAEGSAVVRTFQSARLYYVADGTWNTPISQGIGEGIAVGNLVVGRAILGGGVREQATTDLENRSGSGKYYAVLFANAEGTYTGYGSAYRSTATVAWSDTTVISMDSMNPASGLFVYGNDAGTSWTAVPEPNTFALLALGAAALAARRRRKL
jgi:hypothetical protein